MGIVLGNDKRDEYLLDDFFDYYQRIKTEFLYMMNGWNPTNRPEPVASAEHGRWSVQSKHGSEETDHLSQVAEIRTAQIEKLRDAGIDTLKKLANFTGAPPKGMAEKVFLNLRQQAKLQQMTKDKKLSLPDDGEVVPPVYIAREKDETSEEPRGLELLPPFDPQDIFFDLEGFPLSKEGLEYLWGASFWMIGVIWILRIGGHMMRRRKNRHWSILWNGLIGDGWPIPDCTSTIMDITRSQDLRI